MATNEDDMDLPMPDPLTLQRETTYSDIITTNDDVTIDPGMVTRYLQYECKYHLCKHTGVTWGELIALDYPNFVDLMSHSVARDSNTFLALQGHLTPSDRMCAQTSTRHNDTEEGKKQTRERFLDLTCTHKGTMNGKTWRHILKNNYSYFMWSIGNTMGRDTKSFSVLVTCLKQEDQTRVITTPKGELIVARKLTGKTVWSKPTPTI
jgi:hypothetical protein